jgi:hypothetical protein
LEEKAVEEKEKREEEGQESEISPSKKGKSRGKRAAPEAGDASKLVYLFPVLPIHMFLGLPDPDPDPSIIMQK